MRNEVKTESKPVCNNSYITHDMQSTVVKSRLKELARKFELLKGFELPKDNTNVRKSCEESSS